MTDKVDFNYYNRGTAKYKSDDKDGACLDWSKAGELGYASAYGFPFAGAIFKREKSFLMNKNIY